MVIKWTVILKLFICVLVLCNANRWGYRRVYVGWWVGWPSVECCTTRCANTVTPAEQIVRLVLSVRCGGIYFLFIFSFSHCSSSCYFIAIPRLLVILLVIVLHLHLILFIYYSFILFIFYNTRIFIYIFQSKLSSFFCPQCSSNVFWNSKLINTKNSTMLGN